MFGTVRISHGSLVALGMLSTVALGCGDDGDSNSKQTSYEPSTPAARSDGSEGGDLVALQVRQSEVVCECAGDAEIEDLCLDFAWPEGQAECFRDVINAHAAQNTEALACAKRVVREAIDCLSAAGCNEDKQGDCQVTFSEAQQECPQFDAQTQSEGQACSGISADFDDCENADLCDGFADCADGSDEANCE